MRDRVKVALTNGVGEQYETPVIPRYEVERIIRTTLVAELIITTAAVSSPEHHGRAELGLTSGKILRGFAEADGSDDDGYHSCNAERITLRRVLARAVFRTTGYGNAAVLVSKEGDDLDEEPDADDVDLFAAELYALPCTPGQSAVEVLDGSREALDAVYSTVAE